MPKQKAIRPSRSNPYLRGRSTVIRMAGPDPLAGPLPGQIDGRRAQVNSAPPPSTLGSGSSSSSGVHPDSSTLSHSERVGPTGKRADAPLVLTYAPGSQELALEIKK